MCWCKSPSIWLDLLPPPNTGCTSNWVPYSGTVTQRLDVPCARLANSITMSRSLWSKSYCFMKTSLKRLSIVLTWDPIVSPSWSNWPSHVASLNPMRLSMLHFHQVAQVSIDFQWCEVPGALIHACLLETPHRHAWLHINGDENAMQGWHSNMTNHWQRECKQLAWATKGYRHTISCACHISVFRIC